MNVSPALMSSVRTNWNTPENVLALVREFAPIELDPCTDYSNPTAARLFYCNAGLGWPWSPGGLNYVNPPYGREIGPWAMKMRTEAAGRGCEIIGLVPARTDTRWWQYGIANADAILFWRGRLTFVGAVDSAPFPSALPYWGKRVERFRKVFGAYGWIP